MYTEFASDDMASYQYDSVRQDKELDDDHSTLADQERDWHTDGKPEPRHRSRARRCLAALGPWRWLLDTTLLVVILVLALERRYLARVDKGRSYELAGDLTGFAPTCRTLFPLFPLSFCFIRFVRRRSVC